MDPFPVRHGRPARGWLGDPHGCVRVDGRYHVFFQYNPDGPRHEAIKWGHTSSADLVHWEQEPVALVNRPGELDALGCWTGCVVDDGGVPTAVYSAVAGEDEKTVVLLARGDRRLRSWEQERRPVCGPPADPAVSHARDPFVFELEGRRYALQGAGHYERDGAARVLVYACDDLSQWTELCSFLSARDDPLAAALAPARVWECPNLLRFGRRWVLLLSLWRQGVVRYLVGELEPGPRFRATGGGPVDRGPAFFAASTLREADRTLLWAWAPELRPAQGDWAGVLTFPRELALRGDALVSTPARELDGAVEVPSVAIDERVVAPGPARVFVDGSMLEIFDADPAPYTTRVYGESRISFHSRIS